jgi:hypothetical protein
MPEQGAQQIAATAEQDRVRPVAHNLLATLDAVVPATVVHHAVKDVRRALWALDRAAASIDTRPARTWTFFGHWEADRIVVDYTQPGQVWDDRQDDSVTWPQGLWAASGSGATVEEAKAAAIAAYLDEAEDEAPLSG